MKKIFICLVLGFSILLFGSCYGQKEYECNSCDRIINGKEYFYNEYKYWYFEGIEDEIGEKDVNDLNKAYVISSKKDALRYNGTNILNEVCSKKAIGFYVSNKLLAIYLGNKSFSGVYSIIEDNNKLVIILKTYYRMTADYVPATVVLQLTNAQYDGIEEIIVLEVDPDGHDISILY